jgi:formylmethanofuran dehydrogenase subunit D
VVQIDVLEAGNQAPVLATIGTQGVAEGGNLNFVVTATDAELDSLIFLANGVPTNAIYVDNFDGTGTFDFNPDFLQAGTYFVSFLVSDGVDVDSEVVQINVAEAGNQAPVLTAIGGQSVGEGGNLNFVVTATDADLDSLIFSANGVPANATFVDNFDGTGTFDFNPDYVQAGTYFVSFLVSDGVDVDSEVVQIDVTEAGNQAPVLATIGTQGATEGGNLNFVVTATDADLDSLIFSANGVPTNATFVDNFDGTLSVSSSPMVSMLTVKWCRLMSLKQAIRHRYWQRSARKGSLKVAISISLSRLQILIWIR